MVTVSCHTICEIMVEIAKSCWELLDISYVFIINLSKTLKMIMYALVKDRQHRAAAYLRHSRLSLTYFLL